MIHDSFPSEGKERRLSADKATPMGKKLGYIDQNFGGESWGMGMKSPGNADWKDFDKESGEKK